VVGATHDAREAQTELPRHERLESPAVPVRAVLRVIVAPGQRPVVAAARGTANGCRWRPDEVADDRTGRDEGGIRSLRGFDRFDERLEEPRVQRVMVLRLVAE